jgi:hypothetical protein
MGLGARQAMLYVSQRHLARGYALLRPGLALSRLVFCLVFWLPCLAASAAPERTYRVDIPMVIPGDGDYFVKLLRLTLEASKAPDEKIELAFATEVLTQARSIAEVQKGRQNSVFWTVTNKEREQNLYPIRVPLFKGLLGYRMLVIRTEDAAKFAQVKSLSDLAKFSAGQGAQWPDTNILLVNQLQVVRGVSRESLYKMLMGRRFDYFPRGITEVVAEGDLIPGRGLMIEPHLILHYPSAMYFFVNKQNRDLADRLERGLASLIGSGEFDRLFYSLPRVKWATEQLRGQKHVILELANPDLPEGTPLMDPRYWFRP